MPYEVTQQLSTAMSISLHDDPRTEHALHRSFCCVSICVTLLSAKGLATSVSETIGSKNFFSSSSGVEISSVAAAATVSGAAAAATVSEASSSQCLFFSGAKSVLVQKGLQRACKAYDDSHEEDYEKRVFRRHPFPHASKSAQDHQRVRQPLSCPKNKFDF